MTTQMSKTSINLSALSEWNALKRFLFLHECIWLICFVLVHVSNDYHKSSSCSVIRQEKICAEPKYRAFVLCSFHYKFTLAYFTVHNYVNGMHCLTNWLTYWMIVNFWCKTTWDRAWNKEKHILFAKHVGEM